MIAIPLAGCVITDDTGNVLLLHRKTAELTQWELPGGKLEPGESFGEAAVREVHEETKLHVLLEHEMGHATFEQNDANWDYHWFRAVIEKGEPKVAERKKFDDIRYVNLADIDQSELSPNVINLISAIQNGTVTL